MSTLGLACATKHGCILWSDLPQAYWSCTQCALYSIHCVVLIVQCEIIYCLRESVIFTLDLCVNVSWNVQCLMFMIAKCTILCIASSVYRVHSRRWLAGLQTVLFTYFAIFCNPCAMLCISCAILRYLVQYFCISCAILFIASIVYRVHSGRWLAAGFLQFAPFG